MNRINETVLESLNVPQDADTSSLDVQDVDHLRLIFPGLPARGLEEAILRDALKDFQRTRGLDPHGRPDAETRRELERAASWVLHERMNIGGVEITPDGGRLHCAPSRGPRGTEMDIAAQALQARIEDTVRPRLASLSLVDEMESSSDTKWNTTVAERREQIEQVRHDIFQHGPRAYQRMTPEERHELWVGVLLTGSAGEGARIVQMLRSQSPETARQALDDLYLAGIDIARNAHIMNMRRPSNGQLAETLRTVLGGVPREAWEVELEATWQGDPPPDRPPLAQRQLMQHVLLKANEEARLFMHRHPGGALEEGFMVFADEYFLDDPIEAIEGQVRDSVAERLLGETYGRVLAVAIALHRAGDVSYRAGSWEHALHGAMEDEIWRLADESPLPGTEHLPLDRRAAAIRAAVVEGLEREHEWAEWMSRHPEHPANR